MLHTKNIIILVLLAMVYHTANGQVKYRWPLKQAAGFNDPGYYRITNHVDHNSNSVLIKDYEGGYRTYDGHKGTDIGLFPDKWSKKFWGQVDVVAATAGVIIGRQDGHYDGHCTLTGSPGNYIKLRHSDGTETYYAHLKKNSVTNKQIGDNVQEGEYLGKVASSGNSNGPHLHFGVKDAHGNVIDPFVGPHNPTTQISRWKNQVPYYDGAINRVYVGNDWVDTKNNACHQFYDLNLKSEFLPGQRVYISSFYRNPRPMAPVSIFIFQPNGMLFNNNTNFYQFGAELIQNKGKKKSARLNKSINLPFSAQIGTWSVLIVYDNKLFEAVSVSFEVKRIGGWGLNFHPKTSGELGIQAMQTMDIDIEKAMLQRSVDGEHWETIANDLAPDELLSFEYVDNADFEAPVYYRVNGITYDGTTIKGNTYHWFPQMANVQEVDGSPLDLEVFPNPATTFLQVTTTNLNKDKRVDIMTMNGQVIQQFEWQEGDSKLQLMVDHLPAGIYSLRVVQDDKSIVKRFVKN